MIVVKHPAGGFHPVWYQFEGVSDFRRVLLVFHELGFLALGFLALGFLALGFLVLGFLVFGFPPSPDPKGIVIGERAPARPMLAPRPCVAVTG